MAEAHVRIDEGIKKGPRKRTTAPPATPQRQYSSGITLRPLGHLEQAERTRIATVVLDRYINGEQVAAIAPEFNVSDVTIYALLLREHQEAWKDIQTARSLARLERAQDELRGAADALSLARAREEVRSAQWELERLLNRIYAVKQEVSVDINHHVTVEHTLEAGAADLLTRIRPSVASMPNAAALPPVLTIEPQDNQS